MLCYLVLQFLPLRQLWSIISRMKIAAASFFSFFGMLVRSFRGTPRRFRLCIRIISYVWSVSGAFQLSRFSTLRLISCRIGGFYGDGLNIHCSQLTTWYPVMTRFSNAFCILGFVRPSAKFSLERTNPIFEISRRW